MVDEAGVAILDGEPFLFPFLRDAPKPRLEGQTIAPELGALVLGAEGERRGLASKVKELEAEVIRLKAAAGALRPRKNPLKRAEKAVLPSPGTP